jgi:hypothetical protein
MTQKSLYLQRDSSGSCPNDKSITGLFPFFSSLFNLNPVNKMEEIWKDIERYENMYQVSNLGRVKSLGNGIRKRKTIILKARKNRNGYLQLVICQ